MLTLDASQTFSGKAGTTAVINYTISKDLITTGDSFTPTQGVLTNSTATLYTSTGGQTLVKEIQLVNVSASPVTGVTFYIIGTAGTNQWGPVLTIPANGGATYDGLGVWRIYSSDGLLLSTVGGSAGGDLTGSYPNPTIKSDVALSGNPTTTTQLQGNNSTRIATTAYADTLGATKVANTRNINTTAPLTGGGDLSADRTLALTTSPTGQTPVGVTRTITATTPIQIDGGTSADLSANRTLSIIAATLPTNVGGTGLAGSLSSTEKEKIGAVYYAQGDFGIIGDLITTNSTTSCSTGAPTKITDSANPFTAYYLNKRITLTGAGASGAQYVGTITNIDSAGQVTVSPSISTTVSNKIASFGTDNTTGITAMQTLVNTTNAAFPGVKIVFEQSLTNAYGFPTPVIFNKTFILQGIGAWWNTDNGDYTRTGGTRLAWWGTTSDGGVDFGAFFTAQPGAGATQALKTPKLIDCWLDGRNGDQNAALYGIRWAGVHGAVMNNVGFIDFRAAGYICNATAITLNPTADRGVLRPNFDALWIRNLETFTNAITTPITTSSAITLTNTGQNITVSAATMPVDASSTSYAWIQCTEGTRILVKYTGGGTTTLNVKCSVEDATHGYVTIANAFVASAAPINAAGVVLDGDTTANTNCGKFGIHQITHGSVWGPSAWDLRNCDSNEFAPIYVNGGSPTAETNPLINRTRKEGLTLAGSITSNTLCARNNTFRSGDPSSAQGAGAYVFGLVAAGTQLNFIASANYWDLYQLGNGARIPITETLTASNTQGAIGAFLDWTPNGAFRPGPIGRSQVVVQNCTVSVANVVFGSVIAIPPMGFQVGTVLRWTVLCNKTLAGAAARVWNIRYTTNGANTGGTVIATISRASTAAVDRGRVIIEMTIVGPLGGTCAAVAEYTISKSLATAAGLDSLVATSTISLAMTMATFDSSNALNVNRFLHLEATPGASEVFQITQSWVECLKSANP